MRRSVIALGAVLAGLTATSAQAAPATQVHGLSPYPNPGGCHGAVQSGTLFVNSEVEPWVGDNDNPTGDADPDSLIGTWQQDRFSSGGSSGLLVAYSHDGGVSWIVPPCRPSRRSRIVRTRTTSGPTPIGSVPPTPGATSRRTATCGS
jgi:hypothetical protein